MLGKHYLLTALHLPRVKNSDLNHLIDTFTHEPGNNRELFFELSQHHSQLSAFNKYCTGTWINAEETACELEKYCSTYNIAIISIEDERYPDHLRRIANPPAILFTRGDRDLLDSTGVAITGSQHPTEYGQKCARRIGEVVGNLGLVVTGGLQCGSAAIAHKGCLKGLGKTTAVCAGAMPCPENPNPLAEEIIDMGGLVISAKPPQTHIVDSIEAARITVGLSRALIVVEYDPKTVLKHMVGFATFDKKSVATLDERKHFDLDISHLPRGMQVLANRQELETFLNKSLHTHYHVDGLKESQLSLHG